MKDRVEQVIAKYGDRCDYLEVHVEETHESRVRFAGKNLEDVGRKVDFGGNVRALYKGGWGFASFNSLERMDEFASHAIDQARLVGQDKSVLAEVEPIRDDVLLSLKKDPSRLSLKEKVELMSGYNDQVLKHGDPIKSSISMYFDRFRKFWFGSSEGSLIYQERLDLGGAVVAVASKSGDTQSRAVPFGSNNDFSVAEGLEDRVDEICSVAAAKLEAPKVKGGEYTVIIDPRLAGTFIHEAFGHLSEGDNVYEDEKLQKLMKLGTRFGPPILNVYDTGLTEGARSYLVYDDEGVKAGKTYLLREGELVGRLHNRETAGKMGESATGNARSIDYRFPPICRMRDTCIEKGTSTFDEMISGIDEGVYCLSAQGGQTNGEMFTFTAAEAYMIRDGKRAEMVRDATLTGNVFTTLNNIDMVGDDQRLNNGPGGCGKGEQFPLQTSHEGPHVRIQNLVIGGE